MKLLPRQFRPTEYKYFTDRSIEEISKDLNDIFSRKFLDLKINFSGRFVSNNEFIATRKYNFLVSDIPFDFAIIYGKIHLSANNKTQIDLRITQNKSLTFIYVICLFIGLMCLAASIIRPEKPNWLEVLICGLVFTFIIPLFLIFVGHLNKKIFRKDFVKLFGLVELVTSRN